MTSRCAWCVVVLRLLVLLVCGGGPVCSSRIELKENGYTGIVVALSARLQGNVAGRQLIPPLEPVTCHVLRTSLGTSTAVHIEV
ncbi:unnamed protein product [Ixodes pacificus]